MHSDIHHRLHILRAGELHNAAATGHGTAATRPSRTGVRTLVGWKMVEIGLRPAQSRPQPAAVRAPRTA